MNVGCLCMHLYACMFNIYLFDAYRNSIHEHSIFSQQSQFIILKAEANFSNMLICTLVCQPSHTIRQCDSTESFSASSCNNVHSSYCMVGVMVMVMEASWAMGNLTNYARYCTSG